MWLKSLSIPLPFPRLEDFLALLTNLELEHSATEGKGEGAFSCGSWVFVTLLSQQAICGSADAKLG